MTFFPTLLIGVVRLLVGASARWAGCTPSARQRIYVANHTSHLDAVVVWAALPAALRRRTHPVAARDYWERGRLRPWLARRGFNAVLIDRVPRAHGPNPLAEVLDVLARGDSLIVFPEGTRGTAALPGAFKGGLYRLAAAAPEAEIIPVYLDNLHRSLPKGTRVPLPLLCAVHMGAPLARIDGELRGAFLARAHAAVVAAAPARPLPDGSLPAAPRPAPLAPTP